MPAAACLRSPVDANAPLDAPFQLKAGGTAVVPGGLTIRFDEVSSDSRCPIDVICVHAGEAVVAMTLRNTARREWKTNPSGVDVSYAGYAITLVELQPSPRAGQAIPQSAYVATLTVSKR